MYRYHLLSQIFPDCRLSRSSISSYIRPIEETSLNITYVLHMYIMIYIDTVTQLKVIWKAFHDPQWTRESGGYRLVVYTVLRFTRKDKLLQCMSIWLSMIRPDDSDLKMYEFALILANQSVVGDFLRSPALRKRFWCSLASFMMNQEFKRAAN